MKHNLDLPPNPLAVVLHSQERPDLHLPLFMAHVQPPFVVKGFQDLTREPNPSNSVLHRTILSAANVLFIDDSLLGPTTADAQLAIAAARASTDSHPHVPVLVYDGQYRSYQLTVEEELAAVLPSNRI